MDEFGALADAAITEDFKNLTRAVDAMTETEREAYAQRNPMRYWTQVQFSDATFTISAN